MMHQPTESAQTSASNLVGDRPTETATSVAPSGDNKPANAKKSLKDIRLAWLNPDMKLSFYIQPVLRELFKIFPESVVYTGRWSGYVPGCEDTFKLELVGKDRSIRLRKTEGYSRILQLPSLGIVPRLWQQKPHVVFVVGFSLWALLVLLLKPLCRWRVVIVYSGSSPNIDMSDSKPRLWSRQFMAKLTDAFVTNSQGGKNYLVKDLHVSEDQVFARPYQIPDKRALLDPSEVTSVDLSDQQQPVFLYIGQTTHRKGLTYLLQACARLEAQNCRDYSLVIVGDGPQRTEFENWSREHGLENRVKWMGWGSYGQLGAYYQQSSVFVFPTLEDIWGMVVLEAMLFGKPILCSKDAGVAEMIAEGENGHVFDPQEPEKLAALMQRLIENPELIQQMGATSLNIIEQQDTPEISAQNFAKVITSVLNSRP
ncbi:glycosyltransferase family 4 protein [Egbenema bharatensis]|uniref:glycosyltransferase family 4 protein n=1 Tax=Egbenema bharatensis TaxID=3463334 RepID=UPI003A878913